MEQSKEEIKNTIPLMKISGVDFPKGFFSEEAIRDTLNFKANSGDVYLVTYPKSGTTWTQYIIWSILNKGEAIPELWDMMTSRIPYLELAGTKAVENLPKPRIMKTHLPFDQNPHHPEAKYIYVARNVKDVCVSYFHFVKQLDPNFKDGTLDEFFELYIEGNVGYSGWYEHVHSWYAHKDDPNVLIMTYEWMKKNHAGAVLKVAGLLGKEYKKELENDPSLLKKIVENTTFEAMKKMPVKNIKDVTQFSKKSHQEVLAENTSKSEKGEGGEALGFFRKGQVGDWKNYLSKDQERRLNEKVLSFKEIKSVMTLWGDLWTIDNLLNNC